jgi:hypothetical protein
VTYRSWSAPQDAIKTWIAARTGLSVRWRDDAQALPPQGGYVELIVTSLNDYGRPILDHVYNSLANAGEEILLQQSALQRMVVQCSFYAFSQSTANSALQAVAKFVSSARVRELQTALDTAEVGLEDVGTMTTIRWEQDGRLWSQYNVDLIFSIQSFFRTDPADATGYIEVVEGIEDSGEVQLDLDLDED